MDLLIVLQVKERGINMRKHIATFVVALLVLLTSCASETNDTFVSNGTESVFEDIEVVIINESDMPELSSYNEEGTESLYPNGVITVQDLFEPIDDVMYLQGTPIPVRLYPFGEIVMPEEGRASFVIFIEGHRYVEQYDNLLRLRPTSDPLPDRPPIYMEITQVVNTTAAEAEYQIKSDIDFSLFSSTSYGYPSEEFPFFNINLYEGGERYSTITRIFIRDNTKGGVFVITIQMYTEAIGWGVICRHYINTLEIIDATMMP